MELAAGRAPEGVPLGPPRSAGLQPQDGICTKNTYDSLYTVDRRGAPNLFSSYGSFHALARPPNNDPTNATNATNATSLRTLRTLWPECSEKGCQ
jgi:hypothetical protein